MDLTCNDCIFYLPVDVFQGTCKISKEKTSPDSPCCKDAERLPKCKFCLHFMSEKDYLGKCMGKTLAYPDMVASNCIDFEWAQKN